MKRHNDDGGGGYDENDPVSDHKDGANSQIEDAAPADKQHSLDSSDIHVAKSSKDSGPETEVDHKSHDAGNAAAADDIHGGIKMGVKNEACDDGVVQCSWVVFRPLMTYLLSLSMITSILYMYTYLHFAVCAGGS